MGKFIAVDWGTSSFRAALIDDAGGVLRSVSSACGIARVSRAEQAALLLRETAPLSEPGLGLPFMLCGMVGSNLGLQEVGYLECPADLMQLAEASTVIRCADINGWIVAGLRCTNALGEPDFMRGEETQCLGWLSGLPPGASGVLCMPGTHSKWVVCGDGKVQTFNTVPSGELFGLLRNQSTLVVGEQQSSDAAFLDGVSRVAGGEPLNQILFSCRSRVIAGQMQQDVSADYLSGLIIGAEIACQLKLFPELGKQEVAIVGDDNLSNLYQRALQYFDINSNCFSSAELVARGLAKLYQQISQTPN